MPQMFPMNWWLLLIYFMFSFTLVTLTLNTLINHKMFCEPLNNKLSKSAWKW